MMMVMITMIRLLKVERPVFVVTVVPIYVESLLVQYYCAWWFPLQVAKLNILQKCSVCYFLVLTFETPSFFNMFHITFSLTSRLTYHLKHKGKMVTTNPFFRPFEARVGWGMLWVCFKGRFSISRSGTTMVRWRTAQTEAAGIEIIFWLIGCPASTVVCRL